MKTKIKRNRNIHPLVYGRRTARFSYEGLFLMIIAAILTTGCSKRDVAPIDFQVAASGNTVKVGDSVVFNFTGNPDFITFYSGEHGHEYKNASRDYAAGTPVMEFASYRQYGIHDNTLHIMVSKNFAADYTAEGVNAATWTDVTGRAVLSTGANGTPSGAIDLSDLTGTDNGAIYIGFKYDDTSNGTSSLRTWTITNFTLNCALEDASVLSVATLASAGWKDVSFLNADAAWRITTTGTAPSLKLNGGAAGAPENYNWVISGPLYPNKVSPDQGVAIKNISARLSQYVYQFTAAGVYDVTFVAVNENVYGRRETTKTVQITVSQ